MGVRSAIEMGQCPRCKSFEFIVDDESHSDNEIEYCLVCGFVRDEREGDLPLPHYSMQYCRNDLDIETCKDIEKLYGNMPVDDLVEAEAWLAARESEGWELIKCVLVNIEGHIIWLRGSPGDWNWASKN